MKTTEIRNLVDVDGMFAFVEEAVTNGDCTFIEALSEYASKHNIEVDLIASLIRKHKGKMKARMIEQCRELRLID